MKSILLATLAVLAVAVALWSLGDGSAQPAPTAHRQFIPLVTRDNPVNLLTGNWGGRGVRLAIFGDGAAVFEFDCAHGAFGGPTVAAPDGSVRWAGTWTREHGGPIREGEAADVHPAIYSGALDGSRLQLSIRLADTGQEVGGYSLEAGAVGRLVKCL